jgi:hypothetical protein
LKIHSFGPVLVQKVLVTDPVRRGEEFLNQDHRQLAEIGGNPASAANRFATPYPCG